MKSDDDDVEITRVFQEEARRGRKRGFLDSGERAKKKREQAAFLRTALECDYEAFVRVLAGNGIDPGSDRFDEAIALWRRLNRRD